MAQVLAQILDPSLEHSGLGVESAKIVGGELVPWARAEKARGNFEPLLKLALVEWFALPLEPLGRSGFNLRSWIYQPLSVDNVTTSQAVQAVTALKNDEIDRATRRVAKTFLMVYRFLGSRY